MILKQKIKSVIENSFKIYPTLHGTRDINNMLFMSLMKLIKPEKIITGFEWPKSHISLNTCTGSFILWEYTLIQFKPCTCIWQLPSNKDLRSPYKMIPGQSKHGTTIPSSFSDAALTLQQVKENRAILEANLEAVFRARQEAEVFSIMENLYQEG